MKRLLLYVTFILFSISTLSYAQLASWPLTSNINGTGGPGITAHPVAFGSGYSSPGTLQYDFNVIRASCNCLHGLRVWNWRVTGSPPLNGTTAVNQDRYVEFSFTNNTGQPVVVNSFDFTANAGFTTNCGGQGPYSYLRWMIDGVHGTPQWIRNPTGGCAAEQPLNINSGNAGACTTFSRPNSTTCGTSGWTLSNPATVANGQRIRFRVYIATNNSESTWRVVFGNVTVNGSNPLAVTLNSFSANCESNETEVNWSTESEQHASHFDLERSRDGEVWEKVSTVLASGNSTTTKNYSVTDPVHYSSTGYYRLRQVDFDGTEEIHGPIAVNCTSNENSLLVFPNPTSGEFAVEINSSEMLEGGSVVVYDISGKQLLRQDINGKLKGTNMVYFTDNNLAAGTYLVVVESETRNSFVPVKLVIQ